MTIGNFLIFIVMGLLSDAAKKIDDAVAADLASRTGTRSTSQIGDALAAAVAG
jgi:3-isopropylmalate dehydrogenase